MTGRVSATPWRLVRSKKPKHAGILFIQSSTGEFVGKAYGDPITDTEFTGNATPMVRAPQLAAALRKCRDLLDDVDGDEDMQTAVAEADLLLMETRS